METMIFDSFEKHSLGTLKYDLTEKMETGWEIARGRNC